MSGYASDDNVSALAARFGTDQGVQDDRIGATETAATAAADAAAAADAKAVDAQKAKGPPYTPFASRADAEAASIIPDQIEVVRKGRVLRYLSSPTGSALNSIGKAWTPGDGDVSVLHFGAAADGVADDTDSVLSAMAWISSVAPSERPRLNFPNGKIRILTSIAISDDSIRISGSGANAPFDGLSVYSGGTELSYEGPSIDPMTGGVFTLGGISQCRGTVIEGMTINGNDMAAAVWGQQAGGMKLRSVSTDKAIWGVVLTGTNNNSCIFTDVKVYDPPTGGGGFDVRGNAHSSSFIDCSMENKSSGLRNPANGIRFGSEANSSACLVIGCNFDYYRFTDAAISVISEMKALSLVSNYIEVRADGVSAIPVKLANGGGIIIAGNRITTANSNTYGINCFGTARDITIMSNYFSGFTSSAVRIASGALNINVAGNYSTGLEVINQAAAGARKSVLQKDGKLTADIIDAYQGIFVASDGSRRQLVLNADGTVTHAPL